MRAGTGSIALLLAALVAATAGAAQPLDACAGCHAIQQPDYAGAGVAERAARQAPPLYYAGDKYRREWLVQWLQQPVRLWPGGYFAPGAAEVNGTGVAAPLEHPAVDAATAGALADALLQLRAHPELLAAEGYEPGTVAARMGQLDFRKFKGCNACHQDEAGTGGISGPELHTAWQRLQPDFIASFIADPTQWDPHSMMPVAEMNRPAVHKLVHYLRGLAQEQP